MDKINLSSIKKESVNSIFRSISARDKISRAEIAAETGLSLMTVGKVVDALLDRGIIIQVKETKNVAGRKAGLVHLNLDRFCIVLDMTSKKFSMTVIDIMLHVLDKMEYDYNDDFYYEENIYLFFKNVKIYVLRRLDMMSCIGIGVSVPGKYDAVNDMVLNPRVPELSSIRLKSVLSDIFDEAVTIIEQDTASAAVSNMFSVENYMQKSIAYISLGESITCTLLYHGSVMFEHLSGDIGEMIVRQGNRLSEVMKTDGITEETVNDFVMALYNMILCVSPFIVLVENRIRCSISNFEVVIEEKLNAMFDGETFVPKVILSQTEIPHAHKGLALEMRQNWLVTETLL